MKVLTLIALLFVPSFVYAQEAQVASPKCHLQILNGISPKNIDIQINGKLIFKSAPPGQRITAIPLQSTTGAITLTESGTEKTHNIDFDLTENSYNTLILGGDFEPFATTSNQENYRVVGEFVRNNPSQGKQTIDVFVLNGTHEAEIQLTSSDGASSTLNPLQSAVMPNQKPELTLYFVDKGKKRALYLAQTENPTDLAVVFFRQKSGLSFRAMTRKSGPDITSETRN
jgi:hypothetical protein